MSVVRQTKKHADLIYDVGLHHGQDTDYYLRKGYRVVAFEADPANADFCRERFPAAIDEGRLTIVEGAITETVSSNGRPGKVRFYRNTNHSLWGSTNDDWVARNKVVGTTNEIITVKAIDFGAALAKYGIPHYLKADIVGSETICLKALLDFANRPDYISIRSEKLVFRKLEHEFDLLEQLGYDRFKVVKQEFERVKAELNDSNGSRLYSFEEGASGPFGPYTAGRWKTRQHAVRRYRRIFMKYWLFGDYSYMIQTKLGRRLIDRLEDLFDRAIPGWYDTHARHSSISK